MHEFSYKASGVRSNITLERSEWGDWLEGVVRTPEGLVEVYSQAAHGRHRGCTSYRFQLDGRIYTQTEPGARTKRGLAIMAAKFAREKYQVVRGG